MSARTVLLIDDDDGDNFLHRLVLEESGLVENVVSFVHATEALTYLARPEGHQVDIIFLDINMPIMDGFQFLDAYESLSGDQRAKAVLVMLTTSLRPQDRVRAAERGLVLDYLPKPLSVADVERVFRQIDPELAYRSA